jgi:phosphatidylglycerophosphatase A
VAAPVRHRLGLPPWHPAVIDATWFGSGLLPVTPGSWGSLAALPFAWAIATRWGSLALVPCATALFLLGWWVSSTVAAASGLKDPGAIVVDEVVAQWLVLAVAPAEPLAYLAGFVLFRIADILKPWPASWADRRVSGGLGVMLDDIIAALYAAALLAIILALVRLILG